MFDAEDYIDRVEFENDVLLFKKGDYNPFYVSYNRKKELEPDFEVWTAEDERLANLFTF